MNYSSSYGINAKTMRFIRNMNVGAGYTAGPDGGNGRTGSYEHWKFIGISGFVQNDTAVARSCRIFVVRFRGPSPILDSLFCQKVFGILSGTNDHLFSNVLLDGNYHPQIILDDIVNLAPQGESGTKYVFDYALPVDYIVHYDPSLNPATGYPVSGATFVMLLSPYGASLLEGNLSVWVDFYNEAVVRHPI